MDLSELKKREEKKRDECWDPKLRWKVIQDTITWAESQSTCRRNTPEQCLKKQARLLAGLARSSPS